MGPIWELLWELIKGSPVTAGAAFVTRTPLTWAFVADLFELMLLARLIGPLSWRDAFYLEVLEEETFKLIHELHAAETEEAEDAHQLKRERDEEHRLTPYIFGHFNVWDAYLLARSGYKVYNARIIPSVFQAVTESELVEDAAAGLFF